MDLGNLNGVQFQQIGTNVQLGIYGSVTGRLVNFQIEVTIDTNAVAASAEAARSGDCG